MAARRMKLRYRLFFLGLAVAGFGLAAAGPAQQALEQRRAIAVEKAKLSALGKTNAGLEKDLARLNDQEYLEKAAREQLGVVKPGEISYIVERPLEQMSPKVPPAPPQPWHRRALEWFSSIFR